MTSHNLLFERGINKNYLKYSPKTGWLSLIFIIIICIFLILYISFYEYFSFYCVRNENNIYQVMVPYTKLDLWTNSNQLYYENSQYNYRIKKIEESVNYIDNIVYLQINIEVDNLKSNIPVVEVSLKNEKVTVFDYIKSKLMGGVVWKN